MQPVRYKKTRKQKRNLLLKQYIELTKSSTCLRQQDLALYNLFQRPRQDVCIQRTIQFLQKNNTPAIKRIAITINFSINIFFSNLALLIYQQLQCHVSAQQIRRIQFDVLLFQHYDILLLCSL